MYNIKNHSFHTYTHGHKNEVETETEMVKKTTKLSQNMSLIKCYFLKPCKEMLLLKPCQEAGKLIPGFQSAH